jgi:hydrogenase maturation protease
MKFDATDVVIICFGNPLRGDDALGSVVASALSTRGHVENLHVVLAHQLTPELALPLSRADLAIFVDAATDLPPGQVERRRVAPARRPSSPHSLGHHQTMAGVLAFAERLFGAAPEAWAVTVGGEAWDYGQTLSPPVRAAVPKVLHCIDLIVASRVPSTAAAVAAAAGE